MVLIEVDEQDIEKVFEILVNNGRFAQLSSNQFRIDDNEKETLKKIKDRGIGIKIISSKG